MQPWRRARAIANLLAGPTSEPARVKVRGVDGRTRECFPLRFLLDDEGVDRFRFGFLQERVAAVQLGPDAVYVALPDFDPERLHELEEAVKAVGATPCLVLDLRGNPGGRIRTLQRIAGMFTEQPVDLLRLSEGGRAQRPRVHSGA